MSRPNLFSIYTGYLILRNILTYDRYISMKIHDNYRKMIFTIVFHNFDIRFQVLERYFYIIHYFGDLGMEKLEISIGFITSNHHGISKYHRKHICSINNIFKWSIRVMIFNVHVMCRHWWWVENVINLNICVTHRKRHLIVVGEGGILKGALSPFGLGS